MPYHVGKKGSYGCSGFAAVKDDGTVMGCHKTRSAAAGQIYAINRSEGNIGKVMITEGDFVMFKCEDETYVGRIEYVMTTEGTLGLKGSEYAVESMPDDYAVLIRIYEEEDGVWEEEDKLMSRNMSELTKIASLKVEVDVEVEMMSSQDGSPAMTMVTEDDMTELGKRAGGKMPSSMGQPADASQGQSAIKDPKVKPKKSIGGVGTAGIGVAKSDEELPDSELFSGFGKDFTRVDRRTEVFLPKD
jgi:hypothetical protein